MSDEVHPILLTLREHCQSGDSYIRQDALYALCNAEGLGLSDADFRNELRALAEAEEICLDGELVYLREVWDDEEYTATRLAELIRAKPRQKVSLPEVVSAGSLTLCDEQREAVAMACTYPMSAIIGGAGSGKSATACAVIDALHVPPEALVLCAPTGKAARNLRDATGYPADTLHKSLHISYSGSVQQSDALAGKKLVIVDEAGMLSLHLYAALLKAAPPDCTILLLGDKSQLQGIGPGNVFPDLLGLGLPGRRLTTIHRQQDTASALFYNVSHFSQIHRAEDLRTDESFQIRRGTDEELRLMLVEEAAAGWRAGHAVRVITPRRSDVPLSMRSLNDCIQGVVNPFHSGMRTFTLGDTVFRDGDPVMVTVNSSNRCCFNGDVGTLEIQTINGKDRYCVSLLDGRKPFWTQGDSYIPLELAYATTVHKAQGSGYDTVLLPLSLSQMNNMLTRNLFYTAISRAKERLILFSEDGAIEKALKTKHSPRRSRLAEKVRHHLRQKG